MGAKHRSKFCNTEIDLKNKFPFLKEGLPR